jgi:ADP-heptose:LPS heptosyltransferase
VATVLVYRALGLGDFLTGLPALRGVRAAFPDARIQLAMPSALRPLLETSGVAADLVDTRPFEPLPVLHPDLAVNLHGRGPQSHAVLRAVRPRRLIGFTGPARSDGNEAGPTSGPTSGPVTEGPRWRDDEHEVLRWCRLLRASGIPADTDRLELDREAVLRRLGDLPAGVEPWDATIVHPGASSGARRWPARRFAAAARAEHRAGRRVVVTGGPTERRLAEEVAIGAGLHEDAVLAGRTDLGALAAIVAASARVVCGDTGVAHLATALGTPSVVLFGPTSPAHWGPPPDRVAHVALWAGSAGDPHGRKPDEGLLRIDVGMVLAALARLDTFTPDVGRDGRAVDVSAVITSSPADGRDG